MDTEQPNLAKQFIQELEKFLKRRNSQEESAQVYKLLELANFEQENGEQLEQFQCIIELDSEVDESIYSYLDSRIEDKQRLSDINQTLINSFNYFHSNLNYAFQIYSNKQRISKFKASEGRVSFEGTIQSILTVLKKIPPFYMVSVFQDEQSAITVHGLGDLISANKTFETEIERQMNRTPQRSVNPSRRGYQEPTLQNPQLRPEEPTNVVFKPNFKDIESEIENGNEDDPTQNQILDRERERKQALIAKGIDPDPQGIKRKHIDNQLERIESLDYSGMFLTQWNEL